MILTIEIQTIGERNIYRVFDEVDTRNTDICGAGWSIRDAVNDFVEEYNRLSFFDDDTPVYLRREDIGLKRSRYDCSHELIRRSSQKEWTLGN